MPDDIILPCLKEAAWGRDGVSACRLLWSGQKSPHIPWIGFGRDQPHSFAFLQRSAPEEMGKSLERIEREAVRNLRLRAATWQPLDVKMGWFKTLRMLVCGDDFLAAERILEPGFMKQAQATLKARGLLVGIPRRGFLIVTNAEQAADRLQAFAVMVSTQYHRAESAPISPVVFAMKDGAIVGMVEAAAEAGAPSVPDSLEDAPPEGDPAEPYLATMVLLDDSTGRERIDIMVGGEDFERLANRVIAAVAQGLTNHGRRPEFGGEVRVMVLAFTPTHVRIGLPQLRAHLEGLQRELAGACSAGTSLRITVVEQPGSSPFRAS